jgi:hypothetical protein
MTPKEELRQIKLAQVRQKREAIARARRLADEFFSLDDRKRALQFADEMEVQADEMERTLAEEDGPPVTQAQTQTQMQQQQQGPPANDDEDQGNDSGGKR